MNGLQLKPWYLTKLSLCVLEVSITALASPSTIAFTSICVSRLQYIYMMWLSLMWSLTGVKDNIRWVESSRPRRIYRQEIIISLAASCCNVNKIGTAHAVVCPTPCVFRGGMTRADAGWIAMSGCVISDTRRISRNTGYLLNP